MQIDQDGTPQPRDIGNLIRLTFATGEQVVRSPQDMTEGEANAAAAMEVFRDARWEPVRD